MDLMGFFFMSHHHHGHYNLGQRLIYPAGRIGWSLVVFCSFAMKFSSFVSKKRLVYIGHLNNAENMLNCCSVVADSTFVVTAFYYISKGIVNN
jgi:hypothetical protein